MIHDLNTRGLTSGADRYDLPTLSGTNRYNTNY